MTRPLRILVAEDEPGDILLLKRAFSKCKPGIPVQFANDGEEVLKILEGHLSDEESLGVQTLPTLLLLDLKMPRMGGFEVLRWLQCQPRLRQLLVMVFSASEDVADMEHAYDLGADAYVVKPKESEEFVDVIRGMEKHWLRHYATPECGEFLPETEAA